MAPVVNQVAIENKERTLSEIEARFYHGTKPNQERQSERKQQIVAENGKGMALHNGHHLLKTLLKYSCGQQLKEM